MKAQNAHEDILVISAPSHGFDEVNVCMFCTLAIGVIRVAPHDDLTDLVQDAVTLLCALSKIHPPSPHGTARA
jgi:hypothetical protein